MAASKGSKPGPQRGDGPRRAPKPPEEKLTAGRLTLWFTAKQKAALTKLAARWGANHSVAVNRAIGEALAQTDKWWPSDDTPSSEASAKPKSKPASKGEKAGKTPARKNARSRKGG